MTINLGKRNLGAGTAASPGDTLYIPLAFFNDSGASISIGSSLVVGDIEVFKDGSVTQRATDSGYAILGDTGNFDNRIGFKGISISLYNTADDASFYAVGSTYWVAIDSVTVDARTVRFFPAMFEIGEPRANIVQIGGDTGAANYLKTTFAAGFADTGINERLARIQSDVDTGLRVHIDDLDTGLHAHISDVDTGIHSILQTVGVLVSAFSDTGVNDRLAKILADTDTGIQSAVNVFQIRGDTGGADRFYRYTQKLDTGGDATVTASVDTGVVNQAVWQTNAQRKLTVDTGIADQVWKTATAGYNDDTGTFGELLRNPATATVDTGQVNQAVWQGNATRVLTANTNLANLAVNVTQITGDTGFADRLGKFASILSATGQIDTGTGVADTGQLNQTVWQANAGRGITAISDTGMNERFGRIQSDVDTGLRVHIDDLDTGLHSILITNGVNLGRIRGDTGGADRFYRYTQKLDTGGDATVSASVDTGLVNQAVWQANAQRKLTVDTGIADQVWMQTKASYTTDTGTFGEHLGGSLGGSATVDTGQINQAVWQANAARSITASSDTGINQRFAQIQSDVDTGLRVHIDDSDTGVKDAIADLDTGMRALLALRDTGAIARAVWDEVLTGATHNIATSAGRRLRQIGAISSEDATINDAGATTTTFVTTLGSSVNNFYADQLLVFTSGALAGQSRPVGSYVGATKSITLSEALTSAPANGDAFTMWANHIHPVEQIAGAVWDEADTGHNDTGSFGRLRRGVNVKSLADTGVNERLTAIETQTAKLTFDTGNEILADIRKVNNVTVQGVGDTGTNNTWRPV